MAPREGHCDHPCVPPDDAPTLGEGQPHLLWAQSFHTRHKAPPSPTEAAEMHSVAPTGGWGIQPQGPPTHHRRLKFQLKNTCGFYTPLRIYLQCSPSLLAGIFK